MASPQSFKAEDGEGDDAQVGVHVYFSVAMEVETGYLAIPHNVNRGVSDFSSSIAANGHCKGRR